MAHSAAWRRKSTSNCWRESRNRTAWDGLGISIAAESGGFSNVRGSSACSTRRRNRYSKGGTFSISVSSPGHAWAISFGRCTSGNSTDASDQLKKESRRRARSCRRLNRSRPDLRADGRHRIVSRWWMRRIRLSYGVMPVLLFLVAADAWAQPPELIDRFVVDARGTLARFKEDAAVAAALNVAAKNLPTRGLGLTVGAHWYPLRGRRVTLGLGGEMLLARDSRTAPPASGSTADGPTVSTRFSAITPQLSLNFGRRDGWSYISGGVGLAKLGAERADAPFAADPDRVRALNY